MLLSTKDYQKHFSSQKNGERCSRLEILAINCNTNWNIIRLWIQFMMKDLLSRISSGFSEMIKFTSFCWQRFLHWPDIFRMSNWETKQKIQAKISEKRTKSNRKISTKIKRGSFCSVRFLCTKCLYALRAKMHIQYQWNNYFCCCTVCIWWCVWIELERPNRAIESDVLYIFMLMIR